MSTPTPMRAPLHGAAAVAVLAAAAALYAAAGPSAPPPPPALPPRTAEFHYDGADANRFSGCRWRDPSAVLFLRVPKTGTTALSNGVRAVARANRVHVVGLPEYPKAIGAVEEGPSDRHQVRSHEFLGDLTNTLRRASNASAGGAVPWAARTFLEGHVFHHDAAGAAPYAVARKRTVATPEGVAVVSTARDPYQRLASGYAYTRSRPMRPDARERLLARLGNATLGACAADPACARTNQLGRLCSFHAMYYCGHHSDCALGEDGVATDAAVSRAIANTVNAPRLLMVVPSESLTAGGGLEALEALLPGYFAGLPQAVAALEDPEKVYDPAGTRRSGLAGPRPLPADPRERAAVQALCRQDSRVYNAVKNEYRVRKEACDHQRVQRADAKARVEAAEERRKLREK